MPKRPNILFLMSDEHRPDAIGYAGDTIVRTPVLDSLAESGVVFNNAYTPSPICIPGRQSMMAGQLPRTTGCEQFSQDLPPGHMTFARRFAQYAYTAVACGKLHHTGTDQMQGWTHRIGNVMQMAGHFVEGRVQAEFDAHVPATRAVKWSDTKEILRAGIGRPGNITQDEYTVQGALNFIEQYFNDPFFDRASPNRPLLLKVSLNQPHYPYMTNAEKFNYYLNRVTPFVEHETFDHPFLSQRQVRPDVDVTERDLRRAKAAYYGMIETIDDEYGRILDALQFVGQDLDDWIIVYTSDHGEMLGQHGIWEKQKFFEASVRVPLIIRWPHGLGEDSHGRVVNENVNLCDLFATLCDLADIPTPDGLDSRSMVPLLRGDSAAVWHNETVSQFGGRNLMIKQDHLKYQYYGEDMPEVLFNLQRNPDETVNYIDDESYAKALIDFRRRRGELGFGPDTESLYVNAGY